jgi:peptidyl-prolyl cis-trans isomerase SurA
MCHHVSSFILSAGLALSLLLCSCASQQSAVVATVGDDKITLDEFNAAFAKSRTGKDTVQKATVEDRENFLDLYVRFKLKVKDAYEQGYQNAQDIQADLQEYKRNLAVTLFLEHKFYEPAIHRMYERKRIEVRASHILLKVSSTASPEDTLAAYLKAMKIIDSLKAGRSFEELAVSNSQDPSVASNKGDLYYFGSGAMVPEFEDAVFSVSPGTVLPYPVRTKFGYHIIKVTEQVPNPGSLRISQITKHLTPKSSSQDSAKAMAEMEMVLDSLKHGGKFADLAKTYADDPRLRALSGDIGFIERGRTPRAFEDAVFKLKVGEVSGIVKTTFGLHIAQVTEADPVPSFAEMAPILRSSYEKNHFPQEYNTYTNELKKEYNFVQSPEAVSAWKASVDTSKTTSDVWDSSFSAATRVKDLFTFAGQKISVDSAIHLVKGEKDLQGLPFSKPSTSDKIFDVVSKSLVIAYTAQREESQSPEFEKTVKDYEDGSVIFKAEQNEVWNKISMNDSTLHVFFNANRSKFTWPDRVNVQEIFVQTDTLAKMVTFLMEKQKLPFDSAAAQFNQRGATKEKRGVWGLLPVTNSPLTQQASKMNVGEVSDFFPYQSWYSKIRVLGKESAREKTFDEVGSELSSAFQESESKRLENEWHDSLIRKYPVSINKEAIGISSDQTSKQ